MARLDWDDLCVLLAVARAGTLRVAARELSSSAATLSRRLTRLETHLGEVLLDRAEGGCALTPFGAEVVAWAKAMEQSAHAIDRLRESQNSVNLSGTVRINVDEWIAPFLAARLIAFHGRFPNVELELLTSARPLSLARREAEVAIRKRLPEDGQLKVRRVGSMAYGLFGARDYVRDHAPAVTARDWSALDFIGFDDSNSMLPAMRWLRSLEGARPPRLRCSHATAIRDGIANGCGVGVLAHALGDGVDGLVCLEPCIPELQEEIWIVTHQALSASARIKVIGEFLGDLFRREAPLLRGDRSCRPASETLAATMAPGMLTPVAIDGPRP
jgi:DNA-binding transcriptional LysR family regulator